MNFDFLSLYIANLPLLRGQAYLDPGSGSFLIQLLIAGLVGVGFAIRMSWKRIKRFFGGSKEEPEAEEAEIETPGAEAPDDTDRAS